MAMPRGFEIEIPNDGAGNAIIGISEVRHIFELATAFDFLRDVGAGFTGAIEASVAQKNWTSVLIL